MAIAGFGFLSELFLQEIKADEKPKENRIRNKIIDFLIRDCLFETTINIKRMP